MISSAIFNVNNLINSATILLEHSLLFLSFCLTHCVTLMTYIPYYKYVEMIFCYNSLAVKYLPVWIAVSVHESGYSNIKNLQEA